MRRLRRSLFRLVLLLAVALVAVYAGRRTITEYAAHLVLESNGLADARFEIADIGWGEVILMDVALPSAGISAASLRLAYDPRDLLGGMLREVWIEGLRIDASVDWRSQLAPLADRASNGALDATADVGGSRIVIRRVTFDDAQVVLPQPEPGVITVDGALDLAGDGPTSELRIGIDLGAATGRFTLKSNSLGDGALIALEGSGRAELGGALTDRLPAAGLIDGDAAFTIAGTVQLPGGMDWLGTLTTGLSVAGDLRLTGATTMDGGTLSADLSWALESKDGALRLILPRAAQIELRGLPPSALPAAYLPASGAGVVSLTLSPVGTLATWRPGESGGTLEIAAEASFAFASAAGSVSARVKATHDAAGGLATPAAVSLEIKAGGAELDGPAGEGWLDRLSLRAKGTVAPDGTVVAVGPLSAKVADLRLAGLEAASAVVDGHLRGIWMPARWSVSAAPGLAVALDDLAMPGRVALTGPATIAFDRLNVDQEAGGTWLDVVASTEGLGGALAPGEGSTAFQAVGGRAALVLDREMRGEIRIEEARATLPDHSLSFDGLSARFHFGNPEPTEIALSVELRDTSNPARFVPVAVALTGDRIGDVAQLAGTVASQKGSVSLPVAGTADLAALSGQAKLGPGRIRFRRNGLQPAALSSQLNRLREVAGTVSVSGTAAVDAAGTLTTQLSLGFQDISARTAELDVDGLGGTLRLTSLTPLATSGVQELTARRLVAGVPVEGARARFTLSPRRNGVTVLIREAQAELAGGVVALEDARWNIPARDNAVDLRIRGVSLEQLLTDWQIERISGTGTLSGKIPIRVGTGGVAVLGGQIDAEGPGTIRVDWGPARETMIGAGREAALAFTALEDFRYQALAVGLDQSAGGELVMAIGLDGANPAVLKGHPFRFNINLSGKLGPILEAVREGRQIGAKLFHGEIGGGQ